MSDLEKEFQNLFQTTGPALPFIFEEALDGIVLRDFNQENDFWASPSFWQSLGYTTKQAKRLNLRWDDLIHPEDRQPEKISVQKFKEENGEAAYLPMLRFEHREMGWIWMRVRALYLNDAEPRMLLSFTELTELKNKEVFLQKSSDMARIGYYDWNIRNQELHWSKITREIHGVDSQFQPDFRKAIKFYKQGKSQQKATELIDRALHYGEPFDEELQLLTAENRELWVRVIGIPELHNGRAVRLYGLFQDIDHRLRTENAIRSERELYRQVLQGANMGAWDWDLDSERITLNRKAAELLGYDLETMRREGKTFWFDLLHPDDYDRVWREIKEYLVGARPDFAIEARLFAADGSYRWIFINGKLFQPDVHFERPRVVGIWKDIHFEKKKLNFYGTFIQEAPLAIAMLDLNMCYINCSNKWREDYALEETSIIGRSHYDIFPEIAQEWKDLHRRCLSGETLRRSEDRFIRADGREQWIRWEIRPWYDEDDKIGGMIMYTEDLTEHKEAQKQLAQIQKAFQENFRNAAIGMAIIGVNGEWREVNDKLCSILGYTAEELSAKTFQDLTHPEDLDKDLGLLEQLVKGSIQNYQIEKRYIHKDGSIVKALLGAAAVREDHGEVAYFISQVIKLND